MDTIPESLPADVLATASDPQSCLNWMHWRGRLGAGSWWRGQFDAAIFPLLTLQRTPLMNPRAGVELLVAAI